MQGEMNDNLQGYEAEYPDPQLCSWKDKPSWHHFHSMVLIFIFFNLNYNEYVLWRIYS
jgi:hypothetical protein